MQCLQRLSLKFMNILHSRIYPKVLLMPVFQLQKTIVQFNYGLTSIDTEESAEIKEKTYQELSDQILGAVLGIHRVFIVQPYIRRGPEKRRNTTPELQMEEAEALVKTLPGWVVVGRKLVPLRNFKRKTLMGSGGLDNLKCRIQQCNNTSAVFVSLNMMKLVQIRELEAEIRLPVFDRYALVIHIFRLHAKSPEAKLQVALAEVPYIWKKTLENNDGRINLQETRKRILQLRRVHLKRELMKLREHRDLIRQRRKNNDVPSVAIVGYTNCGKTSLIKALTGDSALMPRNQLFATLDTTAHSGLLPSRLRVVYMDTIGFIQDVPEGLIEPFQITFADALISDIIIHVYDASHPDREAQVDHVRSTLKSLLTEERPIIEIANKCDLIERGSVPEDVIAISAKYSTGIDLLKIRIEKELLNSTGRFYIRIRVMSGSEAAAWLYKELTVTNAEPDPENLQYMFMDVIATETQIYKFKRYLRNETC